MLRCQVTVGNAPLRRWAHISRMMPINSSIEVNVEPAVDKAGLPYIFEYIEKLSTSDVCGGKSTHGLTLLKIVEEIKQGHDMRKVRNKLMRRFKTHYSAIFYSLRKLSDDTTRLDMALYRKIGPRQCMAFHESLKIALEREDISVERRIEKLRDLICFQHDLFPEAVKKRGMVIPEFVHKWFWENTPKENSFDHYYFLIKNDVHLTSSTSVRNFGRRLMQGSEMELQLATLQVFLNNSAHKELFYSKFSKLHSFDSMILILNKLIYMKDFRNVKVYLSALLFKMDTAEVQDIYSSVESKQLLFIKFNNSLLYYLSQSQNIDMFLQTFATELQYMKKLGLLENSGSKHAMNLLHKPLLFAIRLLRKKGMHEEVFELMSIIQKLPIKKNHHFSELILNELISSFRTFNDPKLTCQYVMSGFKKSRTGDLLNGLGLWSAIFHNDHRVLPKETLASEISSLGTLLPRSMQVNSIPSCAILTEMYRVLLSTNARIMNQEQYQDFILNLYSGYKSFLKLKESKLIGLIHDTGILNVFIYHIRFELGNFKLAFEILNDFYNQKFFVGIRNTAIKCPFSLVLYKNYELNESQVSHLLELMHINGIPLNFQVCTSMVIRYLKLNNHDEAHSWYQRILHARFTVRHTLLVQAIQDNGWEYPPDFDMSYLEEISKRSPESNKDAFLVEGAGDFMDSSLQDEDSYDENSLLELVDLIKHIN